MIDVKRILEEFRNFPMEILELINTRVIEAGNPEGIYGMNFVDDVGSLKGFSWYATVEGTIFWEKVITDKQFNTFFEKYPKVTQSTTNKYKRDKKYILNFN